MRSSLSNALSTAWAEDQRLALRKEHAAPLIAEFEAWMRAERARLSRHNDVAKAMDYMLKRWAAFIRFLDDGKICLSNNAAERALRGIAVGRRNWLFAGSDRGGDRAAAIYTLIATAKLNDVDPQAWLADVLRRIADHPRQPLADLLPWNWRSFFAAGQAAWRRSDRSCSSPSAVLAEMLGQDGLVSSSRSTCSRSSCSPRSEPLKRR